ncbi:hypothetical protein E1I69_09270 [Bacillus timonensis]|uniref:YhfM-like domain-containing protein n=1 Tax=Bacillus timonensis TaxID=1033734 RepID=A0A4S3PTH6_9BACI|nr:hypothetical protein [Bacillus timonensis]THE13050.1 hypothetical protein E1I69_09270 [Bacillus timonensis]
MTGCLNAQDQDEQSIKFHKRIGNENKYEDFKEITDNEQVQTVKRILDDADWEKVKVEMDRPPDYQFTFHFKDPDTEAKAVLHMLWVNKYILALVRGNDEYVQLNKEDSEALLEILVGENETITSSP